MESATGAGKGTMITFPRPDGGSARGYLALPKEGDQAPAVVVIQEWWGLQDQIKGVCDRYAAAGFRALAADLYDGKVAKSPDEAGKLMTGLDFVLATEQIVRGAVLHLKTAGKKVGLTGYCMGGAITLLGAALIPELSAAAAYYGLPPEKGFDPKAIKIPVLGHYATKDKFITIDKVYAMEAALKAANVNVQFHTYEADHAFANETRKEVYQPEAAKTANERTMAFFTKHLN